MKLLQSIRCGQSHRLTVPRSKREKLWKWCLAHTELGGVNVRILRSSDYGVLHDKVTRRMGSAVPSLHVRPRVDYATGRSVIGYTDICWSYVK